MALRAVWAAAAARVAGIQRRDSVHRTIVRSGSRRRPTGRPCGRTLPRSCHGCLKRAVLQNLRQFGADPFPSLAKSPVRHPDTRSLACRRGYLARSRDVESMEPTRMVVEPSPSSRAAFCRRVPDGGARFARGPALVVDADSGRVLHAERATDPWFPASITKLMTTYVALDMVRQGQVAMDQLLTVSEDAYALPPSKMAFKPGSPDPPRQRAQDHHGQVGERRRRHHRREPRRLGRGLRGHDERHGAAASACGRAASSTRTACPTTASRPPPATWRCSPGALIAISRSTRTCSRSARSSSAAASCATTTA